MVSSSTILLGGIIMADVFISYSSVDREYAADLAGCLDAAGLDVWWDRELLGGSTYGDEIYRELRKANAVIVLWSEHSIESDWVFKEAAFGQQAKTLIPVRLDNAKVPDRFSDYHILDFSKWSGEADTTFRLLARSVRAKQVSEKSPPPVSKKSFATFSKQVAGISALCFFVLIAGVYTLFGNSEAGRADKDLVTDSVDLVRENPPLDRRVVRYVLSELNRAGYPSDAVVEALIIAGSVDGAFTRLQEEYDTRGSSLSLQRSRELLHQMAALVSYHSEDKAEEIYREILLFNPNDRVALSQLARLAARRGDFERTRTYIDKALEQPAFSTEDRINLELLSLRLATLWEAVPVERFVDLSEEAQAAGYDTIYARGLTYSVARQLDIDLLLQEPAHRTKNLNQLLARIETAIALQEETSEISDLNLSYNLVSIILDHLDQDAARLEYLEKSLQTGMILGSDGDIILAHRNLARFYLDTNNVKKAKQHQEDIILLRSNAEIVRPTMFDLRLAADIAFLEGNVNEACLSLDKAKAQHDALFPHINNSLDDALKQYKCAV